MHKSASMTQNIKDYYRILGVSKLSSDDDVKKVYRKLALKYHPDKNKAVGAEEKFKEIKEAYEFVCDQRKLVIGGMQAGDSQAQGMRFVQDPPVHYDIYVPGKDVVKGQGYTKVIKLMQKCVHPDGSVREQEKIFTINVKADLKAGSKVVFRQEGDQGLYNIPGDVIFTIRNEP